VSNTTVNVAYSLPSVSEVLSQPVWVLARTLAVATATSTGGSTGSAVVRGGFEVLSWCQICSIPALLL